MAAWFWSSRAEAGKCATPAPCLLWPRSRETDPTAYYLSGSGKQEPAFGFGDRAPELPRGHDPLGDHGFGMGERLLPSGAIGRAAGQLRHSAMNASSSL